MATETPKTMIHNIQTDEIIVREITDEEIADIRSTFPDAFQEDTPE